MAEEMTVETAMEFTTLARLAQRPPVDIEFQELSYTMRGGGGIGKDRKSILKNVSGRFRSGELTAVLGPSGAGKSTLLNILVGYVSAGVSGEIRTNGHPRQMAVFNKLSTYIMQEDVLQPRLTVGEAMHIAANLKLGSELSKQDKLLAVHEILHTLGLAASRETLTEQLSGGQRKRLSVALELVNNPPVIFLDEPTTGLDYVAVKQCVSLLKLLASQGRTVVCTIHQPSASMFQGFDHVYALSRGVCVYQGSAQQLVPYLAEAGFNCPTHYNPADYVMELIQDEYVDNVAVLCAAIHNGKQNRRGDLSEAPSTSGKALNLPDNEDTYPVFIGKENLKFLEFPTSFCTQFFILIQRMLIQIRRNKAMLRIQLLHHVLSAFCVGSIYYGTGNLADRPFTNIKFSISVVVFFMYTHVMTPVLLFPTELKLLKREYFNRWYGLKSYFLAITLINIPAMILFGFVFLVIAYTLSSQPMECFRFMWLVAVGILLSAASEAFGLLVGSLFNIVNGSIVAPATVAPLLVLSSYGMGHGMNIEPVMSALMSMSYMRYGLVGITTAIYGHNRGPMECIMPENIYCHYQHPEMVLRDLGMEGSTTSNQLIALGGFLLLYRFMAYLALRYRLTTEFSNRLLNYVAKILRQK